MKYLIYFLLIGLITLGGCKKFLEKLPDNRTEVESADQVTMLLTSAYPHANYMTFCESMSDNAEDKGSTGGEPQNRQPFLYEDVESTDLDTPEGYWDSCYKAIAVANQALQVIDNAKDKTTFQAQRGEALLARAYAHFMLVTLFSKVYDPATAGSDMGIPYVTKPETAVFGQYDRKTVSYVYEMIEKDIVEGLPLINDKIYGGAPKFHFNVKAANAFAARFYLFKRDYAKVIAHGGQVLTGTIADNLRDWNTTYSDLPYYELQAIYTKSSERANILLQETNSLWGRSYASYRFGLGNNVYSKVLIGQNVTGGQLAVGYNVYGSSPQFYNVPKFYEHFVRVSINANIGDPYNVIPLLTGEEVVFNRAEAYARMNNYAGALGDLNAFISKNIRNYSAATHNLTTKKVATFYKTSDTAAALIQSALDLKRAFFIHEGMRWFDILRLKIPVTHTTNEGQTIVLSPTDNRRVLQIPVEAKLSGIPLNPR